MNGHVPSSRFKILVSSVTNVRRPRSARVPTQRGRGSTRTGGRTYGRLQLARPITPSDSATILQKRYRRCSEGQMGPSRSRSRRHKRLRVPNGANTPRHIQGASATTQRCAAHLLPSPRDPLRRSRPCGYGAGRRYWMAASARTSFPLGSCGH